MRDAALQETIDYLLPRVAELRMARGPDDDTVRRMAKALDALMGASAKTTPTGKKRKNAGTERIRGKIGRSVIDLRVDPANVREEER